jgi:replication-associated recombination protein RarA
MNTDKDSENRKVTRFVGHTIKQAIDACNKIVHKSEKQSDTDKKVLAHLRKMQILHADALADEVYIWVSATPSVTRCSISAALYWYFRRTFQKRHRPKSPCLPAKNAGRPCVGTSILGLCSMGPRAH